jgi:hypothetical protein
MEGIAKERTVVSRSGNTEFLDLRVNGTAMPGDEIGFAGAGTVRVKIEQRCEPAPGRPARPSCVHFGGILDEGAVGCHPIAISLVNGPRQLIGPPRQSHPTA